MTDRITGQCLCGACRYASDGPVINVRACHCRRCQRATGSAFYARVMVAWTSVAIDGPVAWFDGDTGVLRGFCPDCGTTLFSRRESAGTVGLSLGSVNDPDRFQPTDHIWTEAQQRWLILGDDLPRYRQGPPVI